MIMSDEIDFEDDEPPTFGRRPCVLVADDDDEIRAVVVAAMKCDGYNVLEARDGSEVLHVMATSTRPPDVIITDVRMPHVSGLTLIGGLRGEGCMTPIIVITAFAADQVGPIADRLGADSTFGKPFDIAKLRTAVMNVLRPNYGPRAFANTLPDRD